MTDRTHADRDLAESRPSMGEQASKTTLCDFPDELLSEIFAHLGGLDTARVQLVCRRFRHVTQDLRVVWRSTTEIRNDKSEISWKGMCELLRTAKNNCKGRSIHAVEIDFSRIRFAPVDITSPSSCEDIRSFTRLLKELDVYHLRVDWGQELEDHAYVFMENFFSSNLLCSSTLESLHLRRVPDFRTYNSYQQTFTLTTLWHLRRLRVEHGAMHDALLSWRAPWWAPSWNTNLTHLHIELIKSQKGARGIYLLLQEVRNSLQVLYLHLDFHTMPLACNMTDNMDKTSRTIDFTQLTKLTLKYNTLSYKICQSWQIYVFQCPRLQHDLYLKCLGPHVIFNSLMTATLKSITIDYRMTSTEKKLKALSRCSDLQVLRVKGHLKCSSKSPGLVKLLEVGAAEIRLWASVDFPNKALVAQLRSRVRSYPKTKTQRIVFENAPSFPQHQDLYDDIQRIFQRPTST